MEERGQEDPSAEAGEVKRIHHMVGRRVQEDPSHWGEKPRGPITWGREAKRMHHMGERGQRDPSHGGEKPRGPIT